MICNLGVVGSNPTRGSKSEIGRGLFKAIANAFSKIVNKGKYQSGQMGQTVNLLAYAFGGSNPSLPTAVEKENANQL